MKKEFRFDQLSDRKCIKCGRLIKKSRPNDTKCYTCHCLADINLSRPNGRNPKARRDNRRIKNRRIDKKDQRVNAV